MPIKTRERRWLPTIHNLGLSDFGGGLNLNDAPNELSPAETPNCKNVVFDDQGAVLKRLGFVLTGFAPSSAITKIFWWKAASAFFTYCSTNKTLYRTTDFVVYTSTKVFSTGADIDMCDFNGLLVVVHGADGVFTWNGAAFTSVAAAVTGTGIAVWQNKCWVVKGTSTTNGSPTASRLSWCEPGDVTTWTGFVDVREKDNDRLMGVAATEAALLVFKEESTYRVNNSTTGSYSMIDATNGAAGPNCVSVDGPRVYHFCRNGMFSTTGQQPQELTRKVRPLFTPESLSIPNAVKAVVAPHYNGTLRVSYPTLGNTNNNVTIEYSLTRGWCTLHSYAFRFYVIGDSGFNLYSSDVTGANLYGLSGSSSNLGGDNAAAIDCYWRSAWLQPGGGKKVRLRGALVAGFGSWTLRVYRDWSYTNFVDRALVLGDPTTAKVAAQAPVYSLGTARAFSFELRETSTAVPFTYAVTFSGATRTVGAVGLSGLMLDFVPLGVA